MSGVGGHGGLDSRGIRSHTFDSEDCTIEADLQLPDPTLGTVEDNSMLACSSHDLNQVLIMLLGCLAVDVYFIMDADDAG